MVNLSVLFLEIEDVLIEDIGGKEYFPNIFCTTSYEDQVIYSQVCLSGRIYMQPDLYIGTANGKTPNTHMHARTHARTHTHTHTHTHTLLN